MLLPVGSALVFELANLLYLLAESCLACKILLFASTKVLKVLLMTLVDDGRCSLEACPDLLAQLLGNGTSLTILLMKFLQLVECADYIFLIGELLSSLTQLGLYLKILLEIVLASLRVELQQVVILLDIELVVAPQLAGFLCRHSLDVLPLLLQFLKLIVRLVGLIGRCSHCLDTFDDGELLLKVGLLLGFLLQEHLCTFFAHHSHLLFECFFVFVGHNLVCCGIATAFDVFLQTCFALGDVQLVEYSLKQINLIFVRIVIALCYLLQAFYNLLLCLVYLVVSHRLFGGSVNVLDFSYVLHIRHFLCTLIQGFLLRVHHFTVLSL